jgi:hypothetical protein
MDKMQAADYVAGILARNQVPFQTRNDNLQFRILSGSTAVFVDFADWRQDTVISLSAPVLQELPSEGEAYWKSLQTLNELNCKVYFGKLCRYGEVLRLEHDLLASRLQGEELMNALDTIAGLADEWDDRLRTELGGKTWEEAAQAQQAEVVET